MPGRHLYPYLIQIQKGGAMMAPPFFIPKCQCSAVNFRNCEFRNLGIKGSLTFEFLNH